MSEIDDSNNPDRGIRPVKIRRSGERRSQEGRIRKQSKYILVRSVIFALLMVGLMWWLLRYLHQLPA